MIKLTVRLVLILFLLLMIFACAAEKGLELEVDVMLDGKPAPQAKILVDGTEIGVTDDKGHLSQVIKKEPGVDIQLSVVKELAGYRIEPWNDSFVMKKPQKGIVDKYPFKVNLKSTKYFTVAVTKKGVPIEGAAIRIQKKKGFKTDANGEFVYDYKVMPKKGLKLRVTKEGYSTWQKTVKVQPGQRIEVSLSRKAIVTVAALTDEYGQSKGLSGIVVSINGKRVGKTNAKGLYSYVYKGRPGKKVQLALSAPGYAPAKWETSITLEGKKSIRRFFYPIKLKPVKVGIFGYANNTPDVDLSNILNRIEEAVSNNLFIYSSFSKVPGEELRKKIKKSNLSLETITTKGWQKTRLIRTVDMIISGSVTKDDKGMTIETKVNTADGKIILSQINKAEKEKYIKKTAKKIAKNIIDRFPFEGAIIVKKKKQYKINLGKTDYKIRRGNEFGIMAATLDKTGRVIGYRDVGTLRVRSTEKTASWTEVANLKPGNKISIGAKVVRRLFLEEEKKDTLILIAKGGLPPDVKPLEGVNIYINDRWVGNTDSDGKARVPIRLKNKHDIVLYKHGYKRVSDKVRVEKNNESRKYVLDVTTSLFKVESEPSEADVFIDDYMIGNTPILEGKMVNFGFRKVKLSVGGDYRDWEKIIEFNKSVEDRTGNNKIVFFKDYLKVGEREEENGNIDAAIQAFSNAEKGGPDYSACRTRLARLYMDEKNDYDSAISEFETVLSLPENQQLIYKQFAVTYTNLGHAYYEKGNEFIREDRDAAAENFAKAIQNFNVAKQNTRFFPTQFYDEAVHDTYYYLALSYHKLFLVTKKSTLLDSADVAWKEYFDFFPKKLEGMSNFLAFRNTAEKYWTQIKDLK